METALVFRARHARKRGPVDVRSRPALKLECAFAQTHGPALVTLGSVLEVVIGSHQGIGQCGVVSLQLPGRHEPDVEPLPLPGVG